MDFPGQPLNRTRVPDLGRTRAFFYALFSFSVSLALSGCLFENGSAPKVAPHLVPLAVGNTWIYLDSTRTQTDGPDSIATDSSLLAIIGTRIVTYEGVTDTVFLENALRRPSETPSARFTYVRNGPHGYYTHGYADGSAEVFDKVLHVKYPAVTGERYPTWFVSLRPGDSVGAAPVRVRDSLEIEVVNADTVCNVPAGRIRCIHYRGWRPGPVLHADAYYAPGLGFVGSIVTRTHVIGGADRTVTTLRWLAAYSLQ